MFLHFHQQRSLVHTFRKWMKPALAYCNSTASNRQSDSSGDRLLHVERGHDGPIGHQDVVRAELAEAVGQVQRQPWEGRHERKPDQVKAMAIGETAADHQATTINALLVYVLPSRKTVSIGTMRSPYVR